MVVEVCTTCGATAPTDSDICSNAFHSALNRELLYMLRFPCDICMLKFPEGSSVHGLKNARGQNYLVCTPCYQKLEKDDLLP